MELFIHDRIRNRKVSYFNNFNLNLKYDSFGSTFSFGYFFDPENIEHKELACIGHYHVASIFHNDEKLLTGYILSETFNDDPQKKLVSFAGYSLPGVLEDCEIPPDLYPLQSDGLTLNEIAQKLLRPFDISMVIDPAVLSKMNAVFEKTTAKESDKIKDYLVELAAQKNIIISHDEKGQLLFTESKVNRKPIFHFDGRLPATSMQLGFNGQNMHSHITVMKQANSKGGNAGEYTITNPYVPFVYRPKVITQSSGEDTNTAEAARNALSDELKNLVLTITLDRWELDGKIIRPNNIITVTNPEIYIYKKTKWFVEEVDFSGDNSKQVAVLKCVLPEVYNNQTPTYLFEGINLH